MRMGNFAILQQSKFQVSACRELQLSVSRSCIASHVHAWQTKGIAGNIVHAIATTNAVAAGLIVVEALKVSFSAPAFFEAALTASRSSFVTLSRVVLCVTVLR